MRIDSRSGLRGVVVRKDDGRPLRWCVWADTETGEYERFRIDPEALAANGVNPEPFRERGRCPAGLRFVPDAGLMAAANRAPPGKTVAPPRPTRDARPCLAVPGRECEEPRCHRLATWEVADVAQAEPDDAGYATARVASVRRYCSAHYRYPTYTTLRGVTRELQEVVQP